MKHEDDSEFVQHEECPSCGSSDACSLYSDGHRYCYSCETYFPADDEADEEDKPRKGKRMAADLLPIEPIDKVIRGINPETFRKFGYGIGTMSGKRVHVAPFRGPDGSVVAQHIRTRDKEFPWLGRKKDALLFGQHLWRDGGRMLVITEGEMDCMSVSQLQNNKYPVVSIKSGAAGAKKDIAKHLDWIEQFDSVIFMFDMDDPGQKAARECALVLTPGKGKIAQLPLKDANEMLQEGRGKEVIDAIWGAQVYRPEGIVTLADVKAEALKPITIGLPWWSDSLTKMTYGRRTGEIYTFGAGTGIGKTDFLTQQVVHDITECEQKVGMFFLEQQPVETAKRVAGKYAGKRFHIPDAGWTEEELITSFEALESTGRLYMFDHFGTANWEIIEKRIRYLAHSEDVKLFYLDHLTALAAAEENEREGLEQIMADMGGLVKELDITIHLVSHLATPDGKPHEEGGRVMIRHFKGSRAIGFWSHYMFGLERNQQAEDEEERQTTTFRVLKDRYTGQATGQTFFMGYDVDQGRLYERDAWFADEEGEDTY